MKLSQFQKDNLANRPTKDLINILSHLEVIGDSLFPAALDANKFELIEFIKSFLRWR